MKIGFLPYIDNTDQSKRKEEENGENQISNKW